MSVLLRWMVLLSLGMVLLWGGQGSALAADHEKPHPEAGAKADKSVPGMVPTSQDLPLWSLVTFVLMLLILGKFVWPTLNTGLLERERKIRQDIADAETNRHKSEAMLKEHEARLAKVQDEVREILAEARRDAEHTRLEIVAIAQKEAEATRKRAVEDIERARDVAMKELFDFVSGNVIGATEHVLGRALSSDDQSRLVQEALNQMGSKT